MALLVAGVTAMETAVFAGDKTVFLAKQLPQVDGHKTRYENIVPV
jgi:hypothetical protein